MHDYDSVYLEQLQLYLQEYYASSDDDDDFKHDFYQDFPF